MLPQSAFTAEERQEKDAHAVVGFLRRQSVETRSNRDLAAAKLVATAPAASADGAAAHASEQKEVAPSAAEQKDAVVPFVAEPVVEVTPVSEV